MLRAAWFWQKEPDTIFWITNFAPKSVFWDVGANVGCYSLYLAAQRPDCTTFAFEPFRPNFDALVENIELNGYWHNIKPQFLGLSDERGTVNFASKQVEAGSSGGQIGNVGEFIPQLSWPVDVTTGDAFAAEHGYPHYIKIDVDGQEARVLRGMRTVLTHANLLSVLVEMNQDTEEIKSILSGAGFAPDEAVNAMKRRESNTNCVWKR